MRLATCVAFELSILSSLVVGLTAGGAWALSSYGAPASTVRAVAAPEPEPQVAPPPSVDSVNDRPRIALPEPEVTVAGPVRGTFEGKPDDELLAPLVNGKLSTVKFNRGGIGWIKVVCAAKNGLDEDRVNSAFKAATAVAATNKIVVFGICRAADHRNPAGGDRNRRRHDRPRHGPA